MSEACAGCLLEFKDKNSKLCNFCDRRIQYATGQDVTAPFPVQKDLDDERARLNKQYDMNQLRLVTQSQRTCMKCGGPVSVHSVSGYCKMCYGSSGEVCKMPDCDTHTAPHNTTGYCSGCQNIVNERRKRGMDIHAPIKRRKKAVA